MCKMTDAYVYMYVFDFICIVNLGLRCFCVSIGTCLCICTQICNWICNCLLNSFFLRGWGTKLSCWKVWPCSNIWMSNDLSIWIPAPVAPSYSLWIYLFFSPPANVFVFIHMNVFVSPFEYICVFAGGIPASLSYIPGSQPVVIRPSAGMSEFVGFSPLPRTHLIIWSFARF